MKHLTLSPQLGAELLNEAARRGQPIREYVDTLTTAVRDASVELAVSEPAFAISDEEAQTLLLFSRIENVLPSSWIQQWKQNDDAAQARVVAGGLFLLVLVALTDNGPEHLTDLLRRFEQIARMTQGAERTRPTEPPAWVTDIQPENPPTDNTNGLHRVVGQWPGSETDAAIRKALERLS